MVLGSTGSIGTQALEVMARRPDEFRVVGLAAGGASVALLARQALETGAQVVAVARATTVQDLQLAFYAEAQRRGWSARRDPAAADHRRARTRRPSWRRTRATWS